MGGFRSCKIRRMKKELWWDRVLSRIAVGKLRQEALQVCTMPLSSGWWMMSMVISGFGKLANANPAPNPLLHRNHGNTAPLPGLHDGKMGCANSPPLLTHHIIDG